VTTTVARELEPFGVEVAIDLARLADDASPDDVAVLRDAYARHDLVLVRGQRLTMDQQVRVCALLGPVLASDSGLMSRETVIGLAGVELCFHSDYGYSPEPLQGISLLALDVVDGETSTRFACGRTAYEALDASTRRRWAALSTLQVFGARLDQRNRRADLDPVLPSTVHPLVWPHEATGGHFLFAPEMTTDSIVGLDAEESEAVVARAFDVLYGPGRVLEHRWHEGDLVLWDNVRVVHARGDVSQVGRRVLQRVTIGTKGYLDLYPELASYEWDDRGTMVEGEAFTPVRSHGPPAVS
jgi:taurine dioxygenase